MIRPNCLGVVMLSKLFFGAAVATALSGSLAGAQSIARLGGPSNLPPASFTGQQFIDARGCVFLKAGIGNGINWVPRVDRNHKPLCGFPPSFGSAVAAAVQADMAPEPAALLPAPQPAAAPAQPAPSQPAAAPRQTRIAAATLAPNPSPAPAPTVYARAQTVAQPAAQPVRRRSMFDVLFGPTPQPVSSTSGPTYLNTGAAVSPAVQCPRSAPKLDRIVLQNHAAAYVCTTGDGTTTGWQVPMFLRGDGTTAALTNPTLNANTMAGARVSNGYAVTSATPAIVVARTAIPTPPKGYKLAWKDDRLNPLRGIGTAAGQVAQDLIWTRDVPAVLVTAVRTTSAAPVAPRLSTSVSTMSAPQTRASAATIFVQVGSFGQPANATAAAARLAALGLPVSTAKLTRGGKLLQVVYAGPFTSAAAAQSALATARTAGFSDAILK